ncbi:hypothetical protein J6590_052047 [Homalodisca vitripennis]|nr:hypothetical protein J6590_052047 [Homalodisca vitripennis]
MLNHSRSRLKSRGLKTAPLVHTLASEHNNMSKILTEFKIHLLTHDSLVCLLWTRQYGKVYILFVILHKCDSVNITFHSVLVCTSKGLSPHRTRASLPLPSLASYITTCVGASSTCQHCNTAFCELWGRAG